MSFNFDGLVKIKNIPLHRWERVRVRVRVLPISLIPSHKGRGKGTFY